MVSTNLACLGDPDSPRALLAPQSRVPGRAAIAQRRARQGVHGCGDRRRPGHRGGRRGHRRRSRRGARPAGRRRAGTGADPDRRRATGGAGHHRARTDGAGAGSAGPRPAAHARDAGAARAHPRLRSARRRAQDAHRNVARRARAPPRSARDQSRALARAAGAKVGRGVRAARAARTTAAADLAVAAGGAADAAQPCPPQAGEAFRPAAARDHVAHALRHGGPVRAAGSSRRPRIGHAPAQRSAGPHLGRTGVPVPAESTGGHRTAGRGVGRRRARVHPPARHA